MKELYRFRQFLTEGVIKKEVTINGKTIDVSSIKIEGVDTSQGYDDGTTDAFASYAEFKDGSELSDNELDKLTDENPDLIHELALEVFQMGESTDGVIKENEEQGYTLYTTNVEYDNGKTGYMYQLVNSEDGEENEIGFDQLYFVGKGDASDPQVFAGKDFKDFDQYSYQEEEVSAEEAMKIYNELK